MDLHTYNQGLGFTVISWLEKKTISRNSAAKIGDTGMCMDYWCNPNPINSGNEFSIGSNLFTQANRAAMTSDISLKQSLFRDLDNQLQTLQKLGELWKLEDHQVLTVTKSSKVSSTVPGVGVSQD